MTKAYISTTEAADRADCTAQTIMNYCRRVPGLGRQTFSRWRIDPTVLEALIAGVPGCGGDHGKR